MRRFALLPILAVLSFTAQGQWIQLQSSPAAGTSPAVTLIDDSPSSTTFRVDIPGFETSVKAAGGTTYTAVDLHTESNTADPGNPEVPYVAVVLAIPDQGDVTVEVVETGKAESFKGYRLPPARPSWKEGDPEPAYVELDASYRSALLYPAQRAVVEKPVVFRDFRLTRVAVYPVQYVPATGEVQVVPSLTIRLRYGAGVTVNGKTTPRRAIAPSFERLYRSTVLNYESMLARTNANLLGGRDVMLVITPDLFADTLRSYVRWKHQSGIYTVVKTFTEIGATSSDPALIKNYILNAYNTWPDPPTHILLVGDTEVFPVSLISYDYTFANEDYFVELEGDDFFPEMFIGRFTHQTVYRLGVMMNKFLKYEQTPYRANTAWFKKGIVASNNAYESQVSTKRFTADLMLTDGGFTSVDTMMSSNPCVYDVADVVAAVTNGRSYLNYRGEGWTSGWAANCLPFHTGDVSTINNGQMFTFVTSIGCGVAMFNADGGNSFGEEWVEMGTLAAPRGACAFVGPTSNTHTTYNNKIDKGIYVGMFQEGIETPGEALMRGKLYMFAVYGNEHWVEYHSRIYCVLGDPSIHIWRHVPAPTAVTFPGSVVIGYNQVQVVVRDSATLAPLSGITVCLAGDSVYALDTTDATGTAYLDVTPTTMDTLSIVARGNTIVPFRGTIVTTPAQVYVAPLGTPGIVDLDGNIDGRVNPNEHCQVSVTLKNWGVQTAAAVSATLTPTDTTLAQVLSGSPASFGDIAAAGSATSTPFQVFVKPGCPVGQVVSMALHVTTGISSWDYVLFVDVKGCILNPTAYVVNDLGSSLANARLDPGETAVLYLSIANTGLDRAQNVSGILRSSDPRVLISDSVGFFGTVDTAATATNLADYFRVSVSDTCPLNTSIPCTLVLSTSGGNYPYSVVRSTSLAVGTPVATDPSGPDGFGYYAYSSDDSVFEQSPDYSWVEIDGLGAVVPVDGDGDYTMTVTLPFTFRYYGVNYTSIRVSSDGWIAFGLGTEVSFQNFTLPYDDNVSAMVALFWDDLFDNDPQEIGKVLYYHDASNHRYIVEWLQVGHWSDATDRETFQVILYDPAFYPTNTGNGDILFQYKIVVEDGSMTAGIENGAENIGLQYVFNDTYDLTASALKNEFAIRFTTELPTIGSSNTQVGVVIHPGWNLVSNPVLRPDSLNAVTSLYPNSVFDYAFAFGPETGYTQHTAMTNGEGYWGKFPAGETNVIAGGTIQRDSVSVLPGWNIIGSISTFVDTAAIASIPAGIRSSVFFGYSSGYFGTGSLAPGQAYWVKAGAPGLLVLHAGLVPAAAAPAGDGGALASLHELTLTDRIGGSQTLFFGPDDANAIPGGMFLMPPPPPEGTFDGRFEAAGGGTLVRTHGADGPAEFPIALRSVTSPLTVSWELKGSDRYELIGRTGAGEIRLADVQGSGSVTIGNPAVGHLVLRLVSTEAIPREFALDQNYPNPFNPTTSVRFGLPVQGFVRAEIFNTLGQRVKTVLGEERKAGFHTLVWDGHGDGGQHLGSGTYFLRLEVRGTAGEHFSATRKLLLIK